MPRLLRELCELDPLGEGTYERTLDDTFFGHDAQFGGYVMALAYTAMEREVDDPTRPPRTFTHQYVSALRTGTVRVDVTVERSGREVTSATARTWMGGRLCGVSLGLFTKDRVGPVYNDVTMPLVSGIGSDEAPVDLGIPARVHEHFEFFWRFGAHDGVDTVDGGWIRSILDESWGPTWPLFVSDLWRPPSMRHPDRIAPTPSIEHTVHFGERVRGEAGEPVLTYFVSTHAGGGVTSEDADVWALDGRLLLRSRQLRRMAGELGMTREQVAALKRRDAEPPRPDASSSSR